MSKRTGAANNTTWAMFQNAVIKRGLADKFKFYCAKRYVLLEDVYSDVKTKALTETRREIWAWLIYEVGWSGVEVGEFFNRNTSTVSVAVKEYRRKDDAERRKVLALASPPSTGVSSADDREREPRSG